MMVHCRRGSIRNKLREAIRAKPEIRLMNEMARAARSMKFSLKSFYFKTIRKNGVKRVFANQSGIFIANNRYMSMSTRVTQIYARSTVRVLTITTHLPVHVIPIRMHNNHRRGVGVKC